MSEVAEKTDVIETTEFEEIKSTETQQQQETEQKTPEEKKPKNDFFNGANTNINEFFKKDLNIKKKPDPKPGEKPETEEEKPENKETETTDQQPESQQPDHYSKIGNSIHLIVDGLLTTLASMIAGEERKKYRISPAEEKEIREAWATIAESGDWKKIPAWLILLVVIPIAYGPVYQKAFKTNAEKKKKKKLGVKEYPFQTRNPEPGTRNQKPEPLENIKVPVRLKNGRYSKEEQRFVNEIRKGQDVIEKQQQQIDELLKNQETAPDNE